MDNQKIADRLIKLRGSRTQAEVAQAIGVTPSAYSMYENGERIPETRLRSASPNTTSGRSTLFFLRIKLTKSEQKRRKNHNE